MLNFKNKLFKIGKEFFDEKFDSKDLKYSEKTLDVKYIKMVRLGN